MIARRGIAVGALYFGGDGAEDPGLRPAPPENLWQLARLLHPIERPLEPEKRGDRVPAVGEEERLDETGLVRHEIAEWRLDDEQVGVADERDDRDSVQLRWQAMTWSGPRGPRGPDALVR